MGIAHIGFVWYSFSMKTKQIVIIGLTTLILLATSPTPPIENPCIETSSWLYTEDGGEFVDPQCTGVYSTGFADVGGIAAYWDCTGFIDRWRASRGWQESDGYDLVSNWTWKKINWNSLWLYSPTTKDTKWNWEYWIEPFLDLGLNSGQYCDNYTGIRTEPLPAAQWVTVSEHWPQYYWSFQFVRNPLLDYFEGNWSYPCRKEGSDEVVGCGGRLWSAVYPNCFSWGETDYHWVTGISKDSFPETVSQYRKHNQNEMDWFENGCRLDHHWAWAMERPFAR